MATQSLYRRYRPRRFAELKGQPHVVRALRTAVAEGREGQAYLFSGPRGTGKTSTARILAKVLNCAAPVDGEPCCECESCRSVERGTSYDVHELDAASNNGVEAMRELIEKASLGTPGRHKVYILDEVHMLSKAAEAALLKTLEEPPPHVVFVLATTDPQKMSDTIRSRTQHLQFHLLPADTLADHVRWVAGDAGLAVSDEAIELALAQGAGSARDTLSALELVASAGGEAAEVVAFDELVEAMVDADPGRALTVVSSAIVRGRDPRTLTEQLVAYLRNGFLSLMAPELVQVPSNRLDALADQARRLGPAGLVRGIEVLGAALADMRHAPDARVLLDVAIVQLTSPAASNDVSALAARVQRLEQRLAEGSPAATPSTGPTPAEGSPAASSPSSPPVDPSTGRAALGGRARRQRAEAPPAAPASEPPATPEPEPAPPPPEPAVSEPAAQSAAPEVPAVSEPAARSAAPEVPAVSEPAARSAAPEVPAVSEPRPGAARGGSAAPAGAFGAAQWNEVRAALRGMARAVYAPATFVRARDGHVVLELPNDVHRSKCDEHRAAVEAALAERLGSAVVVELVVGGDGPPATADAPSPEPAPAGPPDDEPASAPAPEVVAPAAGRRIAASAVDQSDDDAALSPADALPDDDEVDLDDLVDAPPESVKTPIDRLAEAFPGSEFVDERH